MLKKLLLSALAVGAGLLAYKGYKYLKPTQPKQTLPALPKPTDFQDDHHLRFSEETNLLKRLLPYDTAINMRDIGGYTNNSGEQIKWHKIYRGEELSHLSPEDQEKFNALGITHVYDFRDTYNARVKPDILPPGAVYENIPVLKDVETKSFDRNDPNYINNFMKHIYKYQVENRAEDFAKVLKVLADDPDAVLYIHCTNGKDRTGFMIALIELIAGIDQEKVISDYSLSNLTVDKSFDVLGKTFADEMGERSELLKDFFGVDPDWLGIQLAYINDNYDSVDDYLITNTSLTKEDLDNIRKNILENVPLSELG